MVTELLMLAGIRTRVLGRAEQSGALPQPVSPAAEILFLTALKNCTQETQECTTGGSLPCLRKDPT